jgi:hypothetical protein
MGDVEKANYLNFTPIPIAIMIPDLLRRLRRPKAEAAMRRRREFKTLIILLSKDQWTNDLYLISELVPDHYFMGTITITAKPSKIKVIGIGDS